MEQVNNDLLASRARLATISTWAVIVLTAMLMTLELSQAGGAIDPLYMSDGTALAFVAIGAGYTIAFILSVVFVAMWIHRAHANLRAANLDGLEFTPGWAVGWYFIPIANLFKPFQAMRELWNASTGAEYRLEGVAPTEVKLWWACWIISNLASNVSTRLAWDNDPELLQVSALIGGVSSAIMLACAFLLLKLIRDITAGQQQGLGMAAVFS